MLKTTESRFATEYASALSEFLAVQSETSLRRAGEIGRLACALSVPLHEIVATHTAALRSSLAGVSELDSRSAAEFLVLCCQSAETANAADHQEFLRRLAHELRTPLTTLRLSLQVCLSKLDKGDPVTPAALQKSISQVDRLAAVIGELFRSAEAPSQHPESSSKS